MSKSKVFISYGHESVFVKAVREFAKSMSDLGHDVFLDTDYIDQGDWAKIIDEHIDGCDYFFFTVSAETVDYDRYCLKELARAGQMKKNIIPIVLDRSIIVPTGINNLHRLYLSDCLDFNHNIDKKKYKDFFKNIDDIFEGRFKKYTDENKNLLDILKPLTESEKIFHYNLHFCGREDVFKQFENFVYHSSKNIMWVNANPGSGKSAFSGALSWKYNNIVSAIHFCQYNNLDRINTKNIISTIVFQLMTAIPDYRQRVEHLTDLSTIYEKSSARIFEYLIIEQFREINLKEPHVIVIDALDEASNRGENDIATLLYQNASHLPENLKFVVTSRNDVEISSKLQYISEVVEFKEESNEKDLAAFYKMQFPEADDKQINILVTKSEGRFLYASKIVEQIKQNNMSLEDLSFLPVGIYGFFFNCFERLFTDVEVDGKLLSAKMPFDDVRDLLELLCVSQEPISKDIVMDFLGKDEYFVGKLLDAIVGLFNMHNGVIEPLHKSLIDWLTNQEVSHKFYISRKHANEHLASYIKRKYDEKEYDNPFVYKHYLNVLRSLGTKESKVVIKDILNNKDFVEALLELNSFDSGLFKYLDILNYLDPEQLTAVFEGEVFKGLFTKHRRLLYNSGGFKRLKKLGLTPVIDKSSSWGFEGEVAKAFYYYITEEFEKCVKKVNSVLKLKLFFIKHPTLEAELLNVRGLAQRKRVYFKDALASFDHAISCAKKGMVLNDYKDHDPEFEYSLSELIKAKILLRMLNFEESNECANEAIRILANRIDNMGDSDLKISHILFLAEDKRVAADGYIWQFDFETAEKLLEECEQIYIENTVTDRYYTRFLYTRMFLRIFRHDDYDIKSELLSILDKVADKYDEGMVNFYIGLDAYLNHRDNLELLKFGFECVEKSFRAFDSIEAELEENICRTLWKHLGEALGKNCKIEKLNPICIPWCKRFEEIIKWLMLKNCF